MPISMPPTLTPEASAIRVPEGLGTEMQALVAELYPICRSITGNGVRETLRILGRLVPLQVTEVPSGTPVLDWTVPDEWNIREAWIADATGRRVVDFADSNLHVVSYSPPIHGRMSLERLRPHLHALPEHPDWIPYRTSYYEREWGFCLRQRQLDTMADGDYEVHIDSSLEPGWSPMTASGLAQWGPPASKDFMGIAPGRESLRELTSMVTALRDDNEFDFSRLRGMLKMATS